MGIRQELFDPTFILARIQLLDGVKLHFAMQDEIRVQNWMKTTDRGKVKNKTKTKTTHNLLIRMVFPASYYSLNGEPVGDMEIEKRDEFYSVKKKLKIKRLGHDTLSVKHFFEAIQSVYYQFEPLNKHDDEHKSPQDDAVVLAPFIWNGGYFDDYDYDSIEYHDNSDMSYDDHENSVFDS